MKPNKFIKTYILSFTKTVLLLFLIFHYDIYAQDPTYFKLGENKFSNTDIYSLVYDDNTDIIYAGTNNGLYGYKQNKFTRIKSKYESVSFFHLKQNKGNIYCSTLSGGVFKVDNDSLVVHYQVKEKKRTLSFWYHFVEDDNMLIVTNNSIKKLLKNGVVETILDENTKKLGLAQKNYSIKQSNQTKLGVLLVIHTETEEIIVRYYKKQLIVLEINKNHTYKNSFVYQKNKLYRVDNEGAAYGVNTTIYQNTSKKRKERIYSINDDLVIGLDIKKGARYFYLTNDTITTSKTIFKNTFLSSFAKSKKETLLFGTFGGGVIVVPNHTVSKTTNKKELFLGLATTPNNEVGISTRSGNIYVLKNKELKKVDTRNQNVDKIYYFNELNSAFNTKNKFTYDQCNSIIPDTKDIVVIDNNNLLISRTNGVYLINNNKKRPKGLHSINKPKVGSFVLVNNEWCSSIAWNKKDSLFYYTTNNSVYSKEWSSAKTTKLTFQNKRFVARDLQFINNQLVCATRKNGVLFFENNQFTYQISKKDGLYSDIVKQAIVQDNILYVLTEKGLQIFDINKKIFFGLGANEGIVVNKITKFILSKDKIWLLEKNSVYSVNIKDIINKEQDKYKPKLFIDSLLVVDKKTAFSKNNFKNKENKIAVFFDYRNIETKSEAKIEYTLDGFYSEWKTVPTTQNKIEFQSLPTGKYTFKIKATYRDNTSRPFLYSFTIAPPFWFTWWFNSIIVLSFFTFLRWYNNRLNKKQNKRRDRLLKQLEVDRQMVNLKLENFRSQMNPHFIFNALNSIQEYILTNNKNLAADYLGKFSDLIRIYLEQSRSNTVTLEDEINTLKIYLELEKIRFEEILICTFTIDPSIDNTLSIPTMLIQPFVENALKHGLLHKKTNRVLLISFQQVENSIQCIVEDNGVGRDKVLEIQKNTKKHKSFALKANKERLRLINENKNNKVNVEIIDLFSNYNEPQGTKVVITIPLNK